MKPFTRYVRAWALTVLFVALTSAFSTQSAAAQSSQTLGKAELKALIANAKTRAEHEKIANHYRSESERLLVEAKEHEAMAQLYRKQPGPEAAKHPLAYRTEAHCRYVASRYRDAAKKMQELAGAHENMADKAGK